MYEVSGLAFGNSFIGYVMPSQKQHIQQCPGCREACTSEAAMCCSLEGIMRLSKYPSDNGYIT